MKEDKEPKKKELRQKFDKKTFSSMFVCFDLFCVCSNEENKFVGISWEKQARWWQGQTR